MLSYRGFSAVTEFSEDDNIFVGRLIGIDDTVMFESEKFEELESEFQKAVDFHIKVCKKCNTQKKKD